MSPETFVRVEETDVPADDPRLDGLDADFQAAWRFTDDESAIVVDAAAARPLFVARVKAEAGRRILDRYHLHAQANYQALSTELLLIRHDRDWTAEEAAQADECRAVRAWIKSIRDRSDELEAGSILSVAALKADATWATS